MGCPAVHVSAFVMWWTYDFALGHQLLCACILS